MSVLYVVLALPVLLVLWRWVTRPTPRDIAWGDQVVLITGGSGGLGRELTIQVLERGSTVVLVDVDAEAQKMFLQELASPRVRGVICDVTDRAAVYAMAEQLRADKVEVTMLINNAGIVNGKQLLDADDADIERVFQVNALSHVWTVKAFLPAMLHRNDGIIVNVTSVLGFGAAVGAAPYAASKHAALGLNHSLRLEVKRTGKRVHVMAVCPYHITTGMFSGMSWPRLMQLVSPSLVPRRVATDILGALDAGKDVAIIPPSWRMTYLLHFLLPERWFDWLGQFGGTMTAMDTFQKKGAVQ